MAHQESINDTILCVFHRQYKTIISALFVPHDNCSNEPGAPYIGPGAGPQVITEQPVSDLHLHCHPLCHPLSPICNRHPAPSR